MSKSVSVAVIVFIFCVFAPTANAATDDCQSPNSPNLPPTITSQGQADTIGRNFDAYSKASTDYLSCLVAFANANKDSLTDAEKTALKSKYAAFASILSGHNVRWNEVYGTYLANR